MEEKIKSVKLSILNRIEKAVTDESKSLTAETLTAMADIVNSFDIREMERKIPNYAEVLKEYFEKVKDGAEIAETAIPEKEGI